MRPTQWYKNLVVGLGLIFSGRFVDPGAWATVVLAFALFCLLTGGGYILNDFTDREADRKHPAKRHRPIASGRLGTRTALTAAAIMIIGSLTAAWFINWRFFASAAGYLVLELAYSCSLKRIFLVDVIIIGIGFVVRAVAGTEAISVYLSPWLIIATFMLALLLGLAKRHDELLKLGDAAREHRESLSQYSGESINRMTNIVGAALFVSYLLYAISPEHQLMIWTIPFATYGIFRYLYLVQAKGVGEKAERVLLDRPMLLAMACWLIASAGIIALGGP